MPDIEKSSSYDEVPYPSFTFPQTHPNRLAAMARLFGLRTADPEKCRVLELGCGDGTNLLSFAYVLPHSEFVGIDLSATHIDAAKAALCELGLLNALFHQMDLMEFDSAQNGEFDFIIAHGLVSWVPDFVRERVFAIFRDCLTPNGVGYVSYNAFPGCRTRQVAWDLMKFHAGAVKDPKHKVEQGLAALDFVANATDDEYGYRSLLKLERDQIAGRSLPNVIHDDFGEVNQPFYFHEVASMLDRAGLQYVCEAEPTSMNDGPIPAEVLSSLPSAVDDIVRREQYLDFIKFRRFRSNLFCRNDIELDRKIDPLVFEDLMISGRVTSDSSDAAIKDGSIVRFVAPNGTSVSISHPLTKVMVAYLGSVWSQAVGFKDLVMIAGSALGESEVADADRKMAATFLLQMLFAGFIEIHVFRPNLTSEVSDMPAASVFARWQAKKGCGSVTTLWGLNVDTSDVFMTVLLELLDGTRNHAMLVDAVKSSIEVPEEQREGFYRQLPTMVIAKVEELARFGFLVS